ncbi:hypothetical protein [Nonomuraea sp. NPDC049725]|uniref:hypothetical protein n=1 Tax=Nonomuraea sp. NPDC049725 TaxID=3154508 RepID=UPI003415DCE1
MRNALKAVGAGAAAMAMVAISVAPAHADSAWGGEYKGCSNYVVFDREGERMFGIGMMTCNKPQAIMRPEIIVWARNKIYKKIKGCVKAGRGPTYCQTDKLYVPYEPGYRYQAYNAGTTNFDYVWPTWTHARVYVTR